MFRQKWWLLAAGVVGSAMVVFGIGNLFGDDDGPLYGKIVAATVAVGVAGVIFGGLAVRRRNELRGSLMIGVGVLPATLLTALFWFPPVAAVGILSIIVAGKAFVDADRQHRVIVPAPVSD